MSSHHVTPQAPGGAAGSGSGSLGGGVTAATPAGPPLRNDAAPSPLTAAGPVVSADRPASDRDATRAAEGPQAPRLRPRTCTRAGLSYLCSSPEGSWRIPAARSFSPGQRDPRAGGEPAQPDPRSHAGERFAGSCGVIPQARVRVAVGLKVFICLLSAVLTNNRACFGSRAG